MERQSPSSSRASPMITSFFHGFSPMRKPHHEPNAHSFACLEAAAIVERVTLDCARCLHAFQSTRNGYRLKSACCGNLTIRRAVIARVVQSLKYLGFVARFELSRLCSGIVGRCR